jgi:FkbM family methyltransferase
LRGFVQLGIGHADLWGLLPRNEIAFASGAFAARSTERMTKATRKWRAALRLGLEMAGLRPKLSFGLDALDLRLLEFLNRRNGFFVEAGGNDGLSQSNTAYFERYLGWRGIIIEPIPGLAEQCRVNRPNAIVEQCALVPIGYSADIIEMQYCNLMSLVRGARGSDAADASHIDHGRKYLAPNDYVYTIDVPAKTLTQVLDEHNVSNIDLLSLDVEGFEIQALRGLDFDRYLPEYILVEANDPAGIAEMLDHLYELRARLSHHDYLYRVCPPMQRQDTLVV